MWLLQVPPLAPISVARHTDIALLPVKPQRDSGDIR
jgi:hypothetical protein